MRPRASRRRPRPSCPGPAPMTPLCPRCRERDLSNSSKPPTSAHSSYPVRLHLGRTNRPSPSERQPPLSTPTSASPRCHTGTPHQQRSKAGSSYPSGPGPRFPPHHTRTRCGRVNRHRPSPYERPASATDPGALPDHTALTCQWHQIAAATAHKDRPAPPTDHRHLMFPSAPAQTHSPARVSRSAGRRHTLEEADTLITPTRFAAAG